jgi:hypothetical protein
MHQYDSRKERSVWLRALYRMSLAQHFTFGNEKQDTAPNVCYTLVLTFYGHLKKLDEVSSWVLLCMGKAKRAGRSGLPCATSCYIVLNPV